MENAAAPAVRWEWISEGWRMFAEQWQAWVIHMLVYFLIMLVPLVPFYALVIAAQLAAHGGEPAEPPVALFVGFPIFYLAIILLSAYLMAGSYRAALKQLRGGRIVLGDLFSGGGDFLRMLGALFVLAILSAVGFLLCLLPGFIVWGLFFFTFVLVIDRGLGVFEAMRASYAVTRGNLLMFTLFAFVVWLLASLGAYVCYVGMLVSFPLLFTTTAVAYRDCFGVPGARSFAPPMPPPPPTYWAPSPPPPPSGSCSRCQAPLPANATFCPRCGGQVRP